MTTFRMSVATRSSDEAMNFLGEVYSGIDLAPRPEAFSLFITGAGDERFACIQEGMTASGQLHTQPQPALVVLETTQGVYQSSNGRTTMDTTRPSLDRQQAGMAKWDGAFSVNATHIDAHALDDLAARHFAIPGLHVHFYDSTPVARARDRAWLATSAYVREAVATDALLENQLIRDSAYGLLAATLLATFPNNTLDLPDARDGANAVPASLRRAIAYMEEHIADSIALEDIAYASRLSPRGLQDAFVRILGMSPTRYLRRLRMEAVRGDLLQADPTVGDTVAVAAQRWGFTHMARFSARYFDEFGEYPAQTLRR